MALSDWDTLAVDHNSAALAGYSKNHKGVGVEIYKNFLYIHDKEARQGFAPLAVAGPIDEEHTDLATKHYGFTSDVVMQVDHGILRYGGWSIYAERGPKNGVYVVAYSSQTDYATTDEDGKKTYPKISEYLLVGCGVSGYLSLARQYREELLACGYDPDTVESYLGAAYEGNDIELFLFKDGKINSVYTGPDKGSVFVGIEQADVDHLREVMNRAQDYVTIDLDTIDLSKAVRFNPGDAYFADHLGGDIPATAPGKAQVPLLGQVIAQHEENVDD